MLNIGILTISDRASRGDYEDLGGPAIEQWLQKALSSEWTPIKKIIPDGLDSVSQALCDLCDHEFCDLVLTTGGTGPSHRDQTIEAVHQIMSKELPGFGEVMRRVSFETVPTAILSRQTAVIRGKSLIVTLPGKPAAIEVCLRAVFPAIPYCLDLIEAGRLTTHSHIIETFRPKSVS